MPHFSTALCLALAVLGCAVVQQNRKESLLEAAGFKAVAANTPEKIRALKTLPAGKIARVDRDGAIYFVFPDPEDCRCLRVGRQEQYDRYLRLASGRNADVLETTGVDTQSENFKGYDPW